jgi:hypothetical protein
MWRHGTFADAAYREPSAGLFVRRTSCHSKWQSAPCASATQGTTRIKPPPGVPWDAGGEAKAAEAFTLSHLETDSRDAQVMDATIYETIQRADLLSLSSIFNQG